MRFILPTREEYASLIAEPTTGINELIRNLIPFTDTLSRDADKIPLILKKPVNNPDNKPKTTLTVLLTALINLPIFMFSFSEKEIVRQKNTPKRSAEK